MFKETASATKPRKGTKALAERRIRNNSTRLNLFEKIKFQNVVSKLIIKTYSSTSYSLLA
ncbi:MAG: hypothetical protein ACJA1A_000150 [Saprospiraceae bacterium]|jgi:hypothetical protein